MSELLYVIAYCSSLEQSKKFYREQVGLTPGADDPYWADFGTQGASLGLLAVNSGQTCELELCFLADDILRRYHELRERGAPLIGGVRQIPFGKVLHVRDPEGNLISFLEPTRPVTRGGRGGTLIAMVNTRDFGPAVAFYRERLGLRPVVERPTWVEFDTGTTTLAVHERPATGDHPLHAAQRLAFGLEVDDLDAAAESMRERGMHFSTSPTTEDFGPYAEAYDPDGYLVVFREPLAEPSLEEQLAEDFETDGPHQVSIRKPVQKAGAPMSRLVNKPEYHPKKAGTKPATRPEKTRVTKLVTSSPRGTGPVRTRKKPKRTQDPKRARALPATGRLKKAVRENVEVKRVDVARASKTRPVKKAATRGGGKGRVNRER